MSVAISLHPLFSDQAVLPREVPIPVYGRSVPGQTVRLSFAGQQVTARADSQGAWLAMLEPMAAGGPHTLTVSMSGRQLIRRDLQIGDVWLAVGQANMDMALAETTNARAALAQASLPKIRLHTMPFRGSGTAEYDGRWEKCTAAKAAGFSGLGFHFARMLLEALDCPIGIIQATHSTSSGLAWVPAEAIRATPELSRVAIASATPNESAPAAVFNSMIAPLVRFPIRGVIAYQGENDVTQAGLYRAIFAAQIKGWRTAFRREDLPFLFVQLAGYLDPRPDPTEDAWAELREAQAQALRFPRTAMAVAADLGDRASKTPREKRVLAERLMLAALAVAYGRSMPSSGPIFAGHDIRNDAVHVRFNHAEPGLRARQSGPLLSFAIAGADRVFRWSDARIENNAVIVSHPAIAKPVAVRYAWETHPTLTLENAAGLPAAPFRTDNWIAAATPTRERSSDPTAATTR